MVDCPQLFWLVGPKLWPGFCEVIEYEFLHFTLTSPKENTSIFVETRNRIDLLKALLEGLSAIHPQAFTIVEHK